MDYLEEYSPQVNQAQALVIIATELGEIRKILKDMSKER